MPVDQQEPRSIHSSVPAKVARATGNKHHKDGTCGNQQRPTQCALQCASSLQNRCATFYTLSPQCALICIWGLHKQLHTLRNAFLGCCIVCGPQSKTQIKQNTGSDCSPIKAFTQLLKADAQVRVLIPQCKHRIQPSLLVYLRHLQCAQQVC